MCCTVQGLRAWRGRKSLTCTANTVISETNLASFRKQKPGWRKKERQKVWSMNIALTWHSQIEAAVCLSLHQVSTFYCRDKAGATVKQNKASNKEIPKRTERCESHSRLWVWRTTIDSCWCWQKSRWGVTFETRRANVTIISFSFGEDQSDHGRCWRPNSVLQRRAENSVSVFPRQHFWSAHFNCTSDFGCYVCGSDTKNYWKRNALLLKKWVAWKSELRTGRSWHQLLPLRGQRSQPRILPRRGTSQRIFLQK